MLNDDARSLQALSIALDRLQSSLDEQTQLNLNEVQQAIKQLRLSVRKCSPLLEFYSEAFDQLQQELGSTPRNKLINSSTQSALEDVDKALLQEIINEQQHHERKPGLHPGAFIMSDDFNEPLPDSFWLGEA
jgi:BioD-like phosphotransacetylase family protein